MACVSNFQLPNGLTAERRKNKMKRWLSDYIHPLASGRKFVINEEEADGDEVIRGVVTDGSGASGIPIRQGVPILIDDDVVHSDTARSFGFEWQLHIDGGLEDDSCFGFKDDALLKRFFKSCHVKQDELPAMSVLDAGCGSGKLTALLAKAGARHVVGMDINNAIFSAGKKAIGLPNLVFAQTSVLDPKLRGASFDLVWSMGVLHHTPDPKKGFDALAKLVKPGGKLFVWLYGTHWSPLVDVRKLLLALGMAKWPHKTIFNISRMLAAIFLIPVGVLKIFSRLFPMMEKNAICRNVIERWGDLRTLTLIWFDVLSPKYRYQFSGNTVRKWFAEAGYDILDEEDYHVGILGRRREE